MTGTPAVPPVYLRLAASWPCFLMCAPCVAKINTEGARTPEETAARVAAHIAQHHPEAALTVSDGPNGVPRRPVG
jgi:hypothetical protein